MLVVDDDAWILRMVSTVLGRRGYEIVTATDGFEGLLAAQKQKPDLIISDVSMPRVDGWAFVRQLRAKPEFATVPVLFLTALGTDEDRIRGFKLGADDYMSKPFRFDELELRVDNVLKRSKQIAAGSPAAAAAAPPPRLDTPTGGVKAIGIHGQLEHLGLSSVLTILEIERKSGVLVLQHPDGETGRIFLREGRVLRVRLDGKEEPKNEVAVYHLLGWEAGRFEFTAFETDMADEVSQTTTSLLMEGARRLDEAKR